MLDLNTNLATWVGYFLVFAFGTGISINHPYTAVQAVLDEVDVPTGNGKCLTCLYLPPANYLKAILQFTFQLGGALSLCISQTIFLNTLVSQVNQKVPEIPVAMVVAAGAHNLRSVANSPRTLVLLQDSYRSAVRDVFIFSLAASGLALLLSLGFEHRNVKRVAKERQETVQELVDFGPIRGATD